MGSSSKPNLDGILLLEQPFARLPHETLRRQLRAHQRLVDRDMAYCASVLSDIGGTSGSTSATRVAASPSKSPQKAGKSKSNNTQASKLAIAEAALAKRRGASASAGYTTHAASNSSLNIPSPGAGTAANASSGAATPSSASISSHPQAPICSSSASSVDAMSIEDGMPSTAYRAQPAASAVVIPDKPDTEVHRGLDLMIGRLRGLKRKLSPVGEQTMAALTMTAARMNHLADLHAIESTATPEFEEWSKTRLDRMLADYLLRRGYSEAASALARSRGITELVDIDLFEEIASIERSLAPPVPGSQTKRTCTAALAWCSENKAALRKIKSTLEFDLRLQEFIEMARLRETGALRDAIVYAQKHLLPLHSNPPTKLSADKDKSIDAAEMLVDAAAHEAMLAQVSRAMGLLAMPPGKWAYHDLYSEDRWVCLSESFRQCALQLHNLTPQPLLHIALSAGLSSLKLPACYSHEPTSVNKSSGSGTQPPPHLGGRSAGDNATINLGPAPSISAPVLSVSAAPGVGGGSQASPLSGSVGGLQPLQASPFSRAASVLSSSTDSMSVSSSAPPSASASMVVDPNDNRNTNCPVCDTNGLGTLAREVPWSHHTNSTLVCRISGRVMDENDPPLALPNGRVYSRGALEEMAASNKDSIVTCPRTGQSFFFSAARKVYIS